MVTGKATSQLIKSLMHGCFWRITIKEGSSMRLDPNKRRLVYGFATIALAISVAALWLPSSWQAVGNPQGEWVGSPASVTHIGPGVLKPLRLTWGSSPNGFWLGFSAIRVVPLFLSVTLTVAAVIVARQMYRLRKGTNSAGAT
jgi:hypothetical protein